MIFAVMYHVSGLHLHAYSIGSTKKNSQVELLLGFP